MSRIRALMAAIAVGFSTVLGSAISVLAEPVKTVFIIQLENHNWTQPDGNVENSDHTGGTVAGGRVQQIKGNPVAPFINSLTTPGNASAKQVSCCSAYHNLLATPSGNNPHIHPSEPSYIWALAGTNYGTLTDNDPFGPDGTVLQIQKYLANHPQVTSENLLGLMQKKGVSWTSYQEDTDLATTGIKDINGNEAAHDGQLAADTLTSNPVPRSEYTVPLTSLHGTSKNYTNPYNGSHQYDFRCKHDGSLFFTDANGGPDWTKANPQASHHAPLQQLMTDLANNTVSRLNLITPDEFNEMHSALSDGFIYHDVHYYRDASMIAAGDSFLSKLVPLIQASEAYRDNGVIVIWMDETERDSTRGYSDDFAHTLPLIVISPMAKGNAYVSTLNYDHGSDCRTWQEVFQIAGSTGNGYLNAAAATTDLSDLFVPGAIPASLPEHPASSPAK